MGHCGDDGIERGRPGEFELVGPMGAVDLGAGGEELPLARGEVGRSSAEVDAVHTQLHERMLECREHIEVADDLAQLREETSVGGAIIEGEELAGGGIAELQALERASDEGRAAGLESSEAELNSTDLLALQTAAPLPG